MAFYPYLFFGGNCREAFTRYQQIFGGELVVLTAKDMGSEAANVPDDKADMIMHAALKFGDQLLMGSDDPTAENFSVQGMMVNYSVESEDEAERVFAALSDGGTVNLPIGPTSWSPKFGMCNDRFGTPWMISADPAPQ